MVGRLHWVTVAICGGDKRISGVYWRPALSQQEEDEEKKLKSLLSLGSVIGDLNAHHPSWDCNGSCDARGLYIRELADASHSSLMPLSPSVSFFSPATCSCVDLAIGTDVVSSTFLPNGESDHAPLVVLLSMLDGWIPPAPVRFHRRHSIISRKKVSVVEWEGFAGRVESLLAVSHPHPAVTVGHTLSSVCSQPLPDELLSRLLLVFSTAAKPLKRGIVSRKNLLSHFVPSPQAIEKARRAAFFAARSEEIWSVVGKESHAIPPLHDKPSSFVFSDKKKAALLAAHFSSLVRCQDAELEAAAKKQLDDLIVVAALARQEPYSITGGDVAACFPFLKAGAPGEDGILAEFIKYAGPSLCESLAALFNSCIRTRSVPHEWLRSVVVPVPKADKTGLEVGDYRPIALLSILFRLFERVLLTLFVDTLHFDVNMFGFIQDRGVEEALALVFCEIQRRLLVSFRTDTDRTVHKGIASVVKFDLSNAFCSFPTDLALVGL